MPPQLYKWSDIAMQNGKNGSPVWLVIKGSVYDVTKFLAEHPGGADLIVEYAGKDATKAFNGAGHSPNACKDLEQFKIGELEKVLDIKSPVASQIKNSSKSEDRGYRIFCCC